MPDGIKILLQTAYTVGTPVAHIGGCHGCYVAYGDVGVGLYDYVVLDHRKGCIVDSIQSCAVWKR
jgi:hypothetical protein